jgi:hypothetical protein
MMTDLGLNLLPNAIDAPYEAAFEITKKQFIEKHIGMTFPNMLTNPKI